VKQTIARLLASTILCVVVSIGWSAEQQSDPVIATINGHKIQLSYIYQQIESLPLGEQVAIREQLDRFIESIVQEEVLLQSMLATNFRNEPELREQIKNSVADYLIKKYVNQKIRVTNQEIEKYYRENASVIRNELVQVSHILMNTRSECEAMINRINNSEDFALFAKKYSLHKDSAENGGDIGRYMNHPGGLGFEHLFFEMKIGEMRVFESSDGCHVVRVIDRTTPPIPPLAKVSERIREIIERNKEIEFLGTLIDSSRNHVKIIRQNTEKVK